MIMKPEKTLYVADKKSWRAWLARHHKSETEICWYIFAKRPASPVFPITTQFWRRFAMDGLTVPSKLLIKNDLRKDSA